MGYYHLFLTLQTHLTQFLGSMVHKAGAGPEPIPHKKLDVDSLSKALEVLISEPAKQAARRMADQIRSEVRLCKHYIVFGLTFERMVSHAALKAFTSICHF